MNSRLKYGEVPTWNHVPSYSHAAADALFRSSRLLNDGAGNSRQDIPGTACAQIALSINRWKRKPELLRFCSELLQAGLLQNQQVQEWVSYRWYDLCWQGRLQDVATNGFRWNFDIKYD